MNNDVAPEAVQRGALSPAVMWVPGTALLSIGLSMVAEGGLSVGWIVGAVGLAPVLVGAVAQGVAWGMDIHNERHP